MALTRKFLSALGIDDAKADEIIENHTATVNSIKAELESNKADAEKLSKTEEQLKKVQKELDTLKAEAESKDEDEYKTKYNDLKKEYDDYKKSVKDKEIKESKTAAYKKLLKESNISEKRIDAILKLSGDEINGIEFDKDGSVKDKESIVKGISENWADFIQSTETRGADTAKPPANNGGAGQKISRAKQIAQQYHEDLYGKIKED